MRILLVEDEPSISSLVAKVLERAGHGVRTYASPDEALTPGSLDDFAAELAIVDYSLPGMDGLALVSRLREAQPDLAVILCTGLPMTPPRLTPPIHFLQKPYRPSELRQLVEQVTGGKALASHA